MRCVLDGHEADVSLGIQVEESVLVKIASFADRGVAKFDQQSIGVGEIADFHGLNLGTL